MLVLPGDTPLLRARDHRRAGARTHREPDAACTLLTAGVRRPHRLRPGRAGQGRPGRAHRRGGRRHRRGAGDRRGQHLDLLLPPQRAGPGPAPAQPRERPGRVLPDRRGRGAPRRRLPGRRRRGRRRRRDPGRQRPGPAGRGRGRAAPPHQRALAAPRASPCSTPSAPTSTPPSSWPPTSPCSPAPCCRATPWSATGAELGPDTRLVDCVVGARRRRRADRRPRRRDRRRRRGRSVRRARAGQRRCRPGARTGPFYTASARATGARG